MDEVLESLVGFVDGIQPTDIGPSVIHEVKRRVVDSLGCMFGAMSGPPAVMARNLASHVRGGYEATVVGLKDRTTLEMAVFANTVMVRYLDFNDSLMNPAGGGMHASDLIPAQLATAEAVGASGAALVRNIAIAYEVGGALTSITRTRERGWDSTTFESSTTALAAGKMLGLTRDQLRHATAIAATTNISTRSMRVGQLSMWKGCASAGQNRNGIFAALVAKEGITGPAMPYTGKDGVIERVIGEPFELHFDLPLRRRFAVERSNFKIFPSGYNSQGPIELILTLRERAPVDEIEAVHVDTYWMAYSENGMEADKWDPQTRETADHSTAYVLAVALVDGTVNMESFTEDRIKDPTLRPLMQRITVSEKPEFTDRYPEEFNTVITIRLRSGEVIEGHTTHSYGHELNPPTDDSINAKFDDLCRQATKDPNLCHEVREACWKLDEIDDPAKVFAIFGRIRPR